jgi:hypothetical protein
VVVLVLAGIVAVLWALQEPLPPVALPPRGAEGVALQPPELSVVSVPLALSLEALADGVEARVPPVVVDDQAVPTGDATLVDVLVRRTGEVAATGAEDGAVHLELPLSFEVRAYSARKASKRAAKGQGAPRGVGATGAMVLVVEQRLAIDEQWMLRSETTLSHRWIDTPRVELGPIKVGVRKLVDRKLAEKWPEVAAQLDERMAEQDRMRSQLERAWKELATPRPLGEPPTAWLVIEPEALFASDPGVRDGAWRMTVGLVGRVGTTTEPPAEVPPGPLPPRGRPPEGVSGLRVAMPVTLGWEALTELARAELVGPEWPVHTAGLQAATVQLHDLELYPSGTAVAAVLEYAVDHPGGTTAGTLALTATPRWDADARRLELAHFDYVLRTDDAMVARPNVLAEEAVEAAIQERLSFPLGARLDEARLRVNDALAEGRADAGRTVAGRIDTLAVRGLALTDEALVIEAVASGELAVEIDELPGEPRRSP